MDFSSEDYLATLGGSLMKDLLADLQVDDGDWSLEQLERELSTLDQGAQHAPHSVPTLSAASLVVSHAQTRSAGAGGMMQPPAASPGGMDAWSLSLEKFTALSLEQDFLAADTVRKQQIQAPPGFSLEGAEDYDVGEKASLPPPPGLAGGGTHGALQQQLIQPEDIDTLLTQDFHPHPVPNPKNLPKTPHNSMSVSDDDVKLQSAGPQASVTQGRAPPAESIPVQQPAHAPMGTSMPPRGDMPPQGSMPPQGVMPIPMGVIPQQMPPPNMMQQMPPHMAQQQVPVAMPAPMGGPAWQTAPRAPMPPPMRVFCNPHPGAPPIPATALETKFMNARDIAYVIHSILKPVLAEGVSENDYYIQFLRRVGGPQANPSNPKQPKDMNEEMVSRAKKAKEWSTEHTILGHVAKANVARPRALIATPVASTEQGTEQKSRASLWKARIYCDQAYQSYQTVVDIWRTAPPGAVPPQVQLHLMKLMKCMGITMVDKEYQVDEEALKIIVKLSKGRTLFARILEEALLPPNAVQALLPSALGVLMSTPARKDDMTGDRLFRAITRVVQRLNLASATLLACVNSVKSNGKAALSSTARMECVHTLLQKGSAVASQDPSEELRVEWGKAETEFMNMLQGV
jgi:hypothetical protein